MSPFDILQLARSTKALREKLMSKTSKHMWLAARSTMGVPDLNDFSEPYYADLLFSKRCHGKVQNVDRFYFLTDVDPSGTLLQNSDDNRAMRVSFSLGVRWCKRCFKSEYVISHQFACAMNSIHSFERRTFSKTEMGFKEEHHGMFPSFPGSISVLICAIFQFTSSYRFQGMPLP